MSALDRALTVDDLKKMARRRVPKQFFDYIDSGAYTEGTYRANEEDFKKILLRQRVAVNLEDRNLSSTLLGQPVSLPVAIAPVGSTGMTDADGEIKAARAAEKFGIPFTLSTMAICSIEDVAENTTKPFWFQLYVMRDRPFIERLIDRARAAKCSALVLTMDLQILGQRHKDIRNGLTAPPKITPRFIAEMAVKPGWAMRMLGTQRRTFRNIYGHVSDAKNLASLSNWTRTQFDLTLNWKDIAWIKKRFDGPVIVKGVLDPEDAQLAIDNGADAIVVSNHGGRQL
ncbi:MAG TPA: alpha-hydroxy acid oxidase, partial [Devosiaceae bacterium]|nr:alpha-hydroxy acid oxidase [Devosiaceae bacterium]